jgi:hypothetical protein
LIPGLMDSSISLIRTQRTSLTGGSELDLLLNDMSFHGQFEDIKSFKSAVGRIMAMRQEAQRYGRELRCHRSLANVQATHTLKLSQVVQAFEKNESRSLMQWLTRQGPFWEDTRLHTADDYLELNGDVVTDTAIGEAAFGNLQGEDRHVASLTPSSFNNSPLQVKWTPGVGSCKDVEVLNHWTAIDLQTLLAAAPPAVESWAGLADVCRGRYDKLTIADDCFHALRGHPFVEGASRQILVLLNVLNRFAACFDDSGQRSEDGQRLYQDHFTGDKAWFTDSSDTEKEEFKKALTFDHPDQANSSMFCSWHGKVKTPQIRVHFSWPIRHREPVYVVYIGPKLTKR